MRKLYVKSAYFIWALKRINKICLSGKAYYNNEECWLTQGVSDPYWNLYGLVTGNRYENVHRSKFRRVGGIKESLNAFKYRWRWIYSSWYRIDTWKKPLFAKIQGTKFK